jgi:hypothetical protein
LLLYNFTKSLKVLRFKLAINFLVLISLFVIGFNNLIVSEESFAKSYLPVNIKLLHTLLVHQLLPLNQCLLLCLKFFFCLAKNIVPLLLLDKNNSVKSVVGKGLSPRNIARILMANGEVRVRILTESTHNLLELLLMKLYSANGEFGDVGAAEFVHELVEVLQIQLNVDAVCSLVVAKEGDEARNSSHKRRVAFVLKILKQVFVHLGIELVKE